MKRIILILMLLGTVGYTANRITNADVASNAAIAFSKLAALTSGNILVGNGSNVATSVTMSGDATLSNTGALTIANNAVTDAKFRQSAGLSVIGRSANTTGNVADITAASDFNILRRSGTSIGFGSIDLSQSGAVGSSILPVANGGSGQSSYTDGQLLIGNSTGNTLTKSTLTAGSGITITNGSGSITIAATGGGGGSTQLAGYAYIAGTNGCEVPRSSTTFGNPTDAAACPGPTIVVQNLGTWQTTDANNISFTINSLPAGKYIGYMNAYIGRSTGGNACQFYLTDGTTNGTMGGTRGATDTFAQVQSMGYFNYASSGNRTFYTQLRSHDGTNCFLFNYNSANSAYFETSFVLLKVQD